MPERYNHYTMRQCLIEILLIANFHAASTEPEQGQGNIKPGNNGDGGFVDQVMQNLSAPYRTVLAVDSLVILFVVF